MNHSHYLSIEERANLYDNHKNDKTYSEIKNGFFEEFNKATHDSTIARICLKKRDTDTVEDRNHPGKGTLYDDREQRILVRKALMQPFASLRDLDTNNEINPKGASKDTLNKIFKDYNLSQE